MKIIANRLGCSLDSVLDSIANNPDLKKDLHVLMRKDKFLNISLPISAAVTAYGRMNVYNYKNHIVKSGGSLYYSDTDSIYTNITLPDSMISSKLGQMKLECVADKAVFLAPKVYALLFNNGTVLFTGAQFVKDDLGNKTNKLVLQDSNSNSVIRELKFNELANLLIKDSNLVISPEKWYRDIANNSINVRETIYTLKVTENKRSLIYQDGKFVDTKPFVLGSGMIVSERVWETFSNLAVVPYDPKAHTLVEHVSGYSLLDTLPYSEAQMIRNWDKLITEYSDKLIMFNQHISFMDLIFENYPNAISDPVYATHLFFYLRRPLLWFAPQRSFTPWCCGIVSIMCYFRLNRFRFVSS